jgi:mono/diheme cytochrome c family protein
MMRWGGMDGRFGRPWRLGAAASLALLSTSAALSEDPAPALGERAFSAGVRFEEMTGEELFANICQGCHMGDGAGAAGAGAYPSLAGNRNLEASGYPVYLILNGRRAMPPFGDMMTDGQIAAVVNYVRTHFGNSYSDAITAKDVGDARR